RVALRKRSSQRHPDRLAVDPGAHLAAVDGDRVEVHVADPGGNGIELQTPDRAARGVGHGDLGWDADPAVPPPDGRIDLVGGPEVDARAGGRATGRQLSVRARFGWG